MKKAPGVQKPYYRIYRSRQAYDAYILDPRYAEDRHLLCRAYSILEDDLKHLFQYVEPSDSNLSVFSHRTYELLLRASTEFENNCKAILMANGYNTPIRKNWSIEDYYKTEAATRVSQYKLRINIWHPNAKILQPLKGWGCGHTLDWYQDYNCVKHDRSRYFYKASLANTLDAVAAVFTVLYAQFGDNAFSAYNVANEHDYDDDGFEYFGESLFNVKPFRDWTDNEAYVFSWPNSSKRPFQRYPFSRK